MDRRYRPELPSPYASSARFEFEGRTGERALCDVRVFNAPNIGIDYVTAVVTNLGGDEDTSITPVAERLADQVVRAYEVEPTRFIYIEYYPALSASLIQGRLMAPASPARFVRVRFVYSAEGGFTKAKGELIEIAEVAYLTNTPIDSWLRELEETAALNRLYAMLGELGAARTFELLARAIQRQSVEAERQVQEGVEPEYCKDVWDRVYEAVLRLVLCAEKAVLPEGEI